MLKNNYSYEIDVLKTGKSGKKYNLSAQNLQSIFKEELLDLLSNNIFNLDEKKLKIRSRGYLYKLLKSELLKIHHPDNIELFGIKNPLEKNLTEAEKELYSEKGFPKNIITTLTHGTYYLPSNVRFKIKNEIREDLKNEYGDIEKNEIDELVLKKYSEFTRILKHYSDFGTRYTVNNSFIPKKQVIYARNSRSIKDPARNFNESIRKFDFSDNVLPKGLKEGNLFGNLEYLRYHLKINKAIDKNIEKHGGSILIDDHDTGIMKINKNEKFDDYKEGGFPLITLGTLDGNSCNDEIVEYYAERIEFHLGIKPLINKPYKGGYVTQKHGIEKREKLRSERKNPKINNVIQQEVGKFLYLDEKTQKVDKEKAKIIGVGLARAKADLGRKFGEEYFKAVNNGDYAVKNYLDDYEEIE